MRSQSQRIPIISPLEKDYDRLVSQRQWQSHQHFVIVGERAIKNESDSLDHSLDKSAAQFDVGHDRQQDDERPLIFASDLQFFRQRRKINELR